VPTLPHLGRVLCAVDLSETAKAALYTAVGLAYADRGHLTILWINDDGESDDARRELEEFILDALPSWPTGARLEIRAGKPTETILATAAELEANLVVLGTRGRGAIGRAILGSTAAAMLRESPLPVAVVPPSHPEIISLGADRAQPHAGIILVPIDMTPASERQLQWAALLSPASEHHVLMMHVVASESQREGALERMNAAARSVRSAKGFRLLVRVGAPVDEVLHVTGREKGVGAVVLGRSSEEPGKLAYEVLRQNRAVVAMVP
jgi:nucleotide-binding universal stress UspA family protein